MRHLVMSKFISLLRKNIVTNLIRQTTVNAGPIKCLLLTLGEVNPLLEYYYSQHLVFHIIVF